MKNLRELDRYRDTSPEGAALYGDTGDHLCGAFLLQSPATGKNMRVIASSGEGWDHVSVSLANRFPSWMEMEHVKRLFFLPDETVMQLHVPAADHIRHHPYCLHLWRPLTTEIPRPPAWMVGPVS